MLFLFSHAICRLLTFYLSFGIKRQRQILYVTFVIFQIRFWMVDRHLRSKICHYVIFVAVFSLNWIWFHSIVKLKWNEWFWFASTFIGYFNEIFSCILRWNFWKERKYAFRWQQIWYWRFKIGISLDEVSGHSLTYLLELLLFLSCTWEFNFFNARFSRFLWAHFPNEFHNNLPNNLKKDYW